MSNEWESIAARKQEQRLSKIPRAWRLASIHTSRNTVLDVPRECGLLTEAELHITERFDATALLSGVHHGFLRSIDVVTAFCKRAAIAQQVTNCLTEIFFEDAIARAEQLDDILARTGKPVGPLHGLPISLKDTFKVKGYDSSIGIAALCFQPATTNSPLVDLLLSLGAVLYCKTNVPQTMAALDSHNNVFGRTINPGNRALTAGGSSGGEGALVAMRGSILGIGTDIGGSIRVPALCNGLYGVKPSHGRVPFAGQEGGVPPGSNKLGMEATAGPIATSMRDCELLLRVISNAEAPRLDPEVVSQVWDQQTSARTAISTNRRLRLGIARTDGHVTPLPPIKRLIDEIQQALSSRTDQFEVVEVDLSSLGPKCLKTFNTIFSIDGAQAWMDMLAKTGEPLSPWLQGRLRRRDPKRLAEVRDVQAQKTALQMEALGIWHESGGYWRTPNQSQTSGDRSLDVLILPAAPHPVPAVDRWNTVNYSAMFNLLDLPAGVIPVRQLSDRDLQDEIPDSQPMNGWDKTNREMWTKLDRKVYLDSTLSIQVVAPRLMERKLVESMAILDQALREGGDSSGPRSRL